ncbi:hypothetical protein ILUMI_02034 [Ignelater luminosus]|uniref:Uncharacterized protein n=1 Tax=Ignelater luminosus TaxID=2038154 RepID=A0A8K0DDB4_IGNLU|nr:hypothetical protein ILUMI_02034 [Ignelater luminosus]
MYLLQYLPLVLVVLVYQVVQSESCTKVTFVDALIKIRKKDSINFLERFTARITGCIVPEIIAEQLGEITVLGIECYNQSVPTLQEGAVSNLPEIDGLVISYSKVKRIRQRAFSNLARLTSLTLSHNEIESIDNDAFYNLNSLVYVYLSDNKIAFLEFGVFSTLPKLLRIHLDNNELEVFEAEWFADDANLHTIDLNHNFIRSIHKNTFKPFRTLNSLELSSNRIQFIHKDAFDNLEMLETLYLHDNRLRKLEPDIFKGIKNIYSLWINGNNLTYMPDKILQDLRSPKLFQLTIHTNPWQCACYNNIMQWATKRTKKVFVVTGVECFSDDNPVCLYPSENEDLCLENREEDLNKIFYEMYAGPCGE